LPRCCLSPLPLPLPLPTPPPPNTLTHTPQGDSDAHDEDGNGELFDDGQEALDRVAIALGGKALVPAAAQLLPLWLGDGGDWRKRHAALICLAQIAEGCSKVRRVVLSALEEVHVAPFPSPSPSS
jgi:hypothetical protein